MKKFLLSAIFILGMPGLSLAQDPDPQKIIDETRAIYQAMKSFSSDVTVSWDGTFSGQPHKSLVQGKIRLLKPDFYNILWTNRSPGPGGSGKGVVWNSGKGPFMYTGYTYTSSNTNEVNLSTATGVSSGIVNTVPAIFYSLKADQLAGLKDIKFKGTEIVNGTDCYVLEGETGQGPKVFWISQGDNLLIKTQHNVDTQTMDISKFDLSDEEIKKSLMEMGEPVTSQNIEGMKRMMQFSKKTMAQSNMKGTEIETYSNIQINPAIEQGALEYKVPAGVALNNDAYRDMLNPKKIDEIEETLEKVRDLR